MTIQHLNEDGSITREWMLGNADSNTVTLVTISRYRLGSDLYRGTVWAYDYISNNGGLHRDYGKGLANVRQFVKRNFPNATIVEDWK